MVIATERFEDLARRSGEQCGLPTARVVAVAHPVGGVSHDELRSRADAVVEDVVRQLLVR